MTVHGSLEDGGGGFSPLNLQSYINSILISYNQNTAHSHTTPFLDHTHTQ